jgi:hypothetical protein
MGMVTLESEILLRVLVKIRHPNARCSVCGSGLCVVCKAYKALKDADGGSVDRWVEDKVIEQDAWSRGL